MINKAANIQGPQAPAKQANDNSLQLDLPPCIKIITKQDEEDLRKFVNSIVAASNKNCLIMLQEMVTKQNLPLQELVKKLEG
jgi:regulatory protein YycI of two-component signal transduction system YycFG